METATSPLLDHKVAREELSHAVISLSNRGLYYSAKWAAEFLNQIGTSIRVTRRSVKLLNGTLINLINNYSAKKLEAVKISGIIKKNYNMEATLLKFGTNLTKVAS